MFLLADADELSGGENEIINAETDQKDKSSIENVNNNNKNAQKNQSKTKQIDSKKKNKFCYDPCSSKSVKK